MLQVLYDICKMSDDVSPKKKKRYSKDFKNDAVKRVRNGEKEDKVAQDLEIPRSTLATWMQKDREKLSTSKSIKDRTDQIEKRFVFTMNKTVQRSVDLDNEYASPIHSFNNIEKERVNYGVEQHDSTQEQIRIKKSTGDLPTEFANMIQGNVSGNNIEVQTDRSKMMSDRQLLYYGEENQSEEFNIPINTSEKTPSIIDHAHSSSSAFHNLERENYSVEQQQLAIALVLSGAKIETVSIDMDIPPSTIISWLNKNDTPSVDGNEDINEIVSTSSLNDPYFVDDTRNDEKEKQIDIDMCNEVQKKTEPERKKYSTEQQQLAIARVLTGAKIATVSKDMDIPPSTISTWLKKAKPPTVDDNEIRPETIITAKHPYPIVLDENNGKTEFNALVENLDGNLCAVKDSISPSRTESTATAPLNKGKKKEEYMLTESMTHTNVLIFKYPEGSKSANEMAKKQMDRKKDVSANSCSKKSPEQQRYKETDQMIVNCSPRGEKTYVTPSTSPSNNSIWIAKAGEKLRELYKSKDVRPNKQLCNEPENDSKQSNNNATSNERCDVFRSPCSSDENSGLCSVTDSIKTGNTSLAHKLNLPDKNAKMICTRGVKRIGYTPEVKKKALERVKGGEKIASVGKDLGIPGSTIWDWTRKEKMTRENAQLDDCVPPVKWKKWQEIMSAENYGKGWTERDIGYRLEKLSQYFEDKYGLFEFAVCKPTEKSVKVENIVYVKDGKILTLLERHCRYGFQKSILINNKLRDGYSIKARIYIRPKFGVIPLFS
ncbi:uncharacterized protein LOC123525292 [Mercenaria mercenaria]|uniref:uncharacterized protein LOC123525292 n=1 Tax=Mercenaria mercenaria TaxID=6596 RepID=UPI00234E9E5C|nr:uncharacterized protein LOC123525292 [Mercenaria mercenaria]